MRSYCGGEVNESVRYAAGCNVLPSRLPNVGIVSDQTFHATSQSLCKIAMVIWTTPYQSNQVSFGSLGGCRSSDL